VGKRKRRRRKGCWAARQAKLGRGRKKRAGLDLGLG